MSRKHFFIIGVGLFVVLCASVIAEAIGQDHTEQEVVRRMSCPFHLRGGLSGAILGLWHEGYRWEDDWQLFNYPNPMDRSLADYVPEGNPPYLISRSDLARWDNPRYRTECWVREVWSRGRIVRARDSIPIVAFFGTVRPCTPLGGYDPPVDHELYDPYAPSQLSSSDAEGECGGTGANPTGGGGGEDGTDLWGTNGVGSEAVCAGGPVVYDNVCVDVWNAMTGRWEEVWCGVAAFCV